MEIQNIIFNILKSSAQYWIRYWIQEESQGLTFRGEYIELRVHYLDGQKLKDLFDAGFEIDRIQSKKIDADCYCDILMKRDLNYQNQGK